MGPVGGGRARGGLGPKVVAPPFPLPLAKLAYRVDVQTAVTFGRGTIKGSSRSRWIGEGTSYRMRPSWLKSVRTIESYSPLKFNLAIADERREIEGWG